MHKLPLSQVEANIKLFESFSTPMCRLCEVRWLPRDSIMFECGHPDYNAPCERNKWVKSRCTDHRGTENLESKGKKQNTEFILATETGIDVSRTQFKIMAVGCKQGKMRTGQCIQGDVGFIKHLFETTSLQRKLLATRLNSVTFHICLSTPEPRCENATVKQTWDIEKLPRKASCASASIQRGKDFPVASQGRSVKGEVPGQEDGEDRGEGREDAIECKGRKGCRNSTVLHTMWRLKAMVPRTATTHCSIVRWQKDVTASVVNAWQISPLLPLSGWRTFVLEGTKRLHDPQGRTEY